MFRKKLVLLLEMI